MRHALVRTADEGWAFARVLGLVSFASGFGSFGIIAFTIAPNQNLYETILGILLMGLAGGISLLFAGLTVHGFRRLKKRLTRAPWEPYS
jgi:hypothetical protein